MSTIVNIKLYPKTILYLQLYKKPHWIPAILLAGGKWLAVRRGKGACLNSAFSCINVAWVL
jgi:hypothetical protein